MNDDRQVIDALRQDRFDARTLDPDQVMAGARRRRRRHRAATGLASTAVTGVAITAFAVANGIGGPAATTQPQVAGAGGPSAPATTTTAESTPVKPGPVRSWVPGGAVGAKPIGTIPASGKVEIADEYWFETKGTRWCTTRKDGSQLIEPFGCRGTVGNSNLGDDGRLSNYQGSGTADGRRVVSSVFRREGERRVLYTHGNTYYEAKLYRLAGVPGWMMAVATIPAEKDGSKRRPTTPDVAVFGYDAGGKLVNRFPDVKDGGPKTDPLH